MKIRVNNFKKMAQGKKISLLGKVRTKLSAGKTGFFVTKFREILRLKSENEVKEILKRISRLEENNELTQKDIIKARNKGNEELAKHYENVIETNQKALNRARDELVKAQKKLEKSADKDAEFYELVVSSDMKKHYSNSGEPIITEQEKKRRLASYYVNGRFEFGNKKIKVYKGISKKVYAEIMREFNQMEKSYNMDAIRSLESIGMAVIGPDFIRKFSILNNENRDIITQKLTNIFINYIFPSFETEEKFENYRQASLEEQVKYLKSLDLPLLRFDIIELLEKQDTQSNFKEIKAEYEPVVPPQELEPTLESDAYEPVKPTEPMPEPEITQQPKPTPEPKIEKAKDKYEMAIENAQIKQDEIRNKMQDVRNKYERKVQDAATFYQNDPDAIYSIREANASSLHDELSKLEEELDKAKQEEQDAFLARRQEKIEADKKARQERIDEINKKGKEKWESEQKNKALAEAKSILSHLETSTGTYDISNMTDDEIMEVYDSIKDAPSMSDRITEAYENSKKDVPSMSTQIENAEQEIEKEEEKSSIESDKTFESSEPTPTSEIDEPEFEDFEPEEPIIETTPETEKQDSELEEIDLQPVTEEEFKSRARRVREMQQKAKDELGLTDDQAKAFDDPDLQAAFESLYGEEPKENTSGKQR